MQHLPAEWHKHAFTQLTWPHDDTDWAPVMPQAVDCFCNIAREVAQREPLLIAAQYPQAVVEDLLIHGVSLDNITIAPTNNNDTWARDHAFITTLDEAGKTAVLHDFQFNGWGMKFAACFDNLINKSIAEGVVDIYGKHGIGAKYSNQLDFVLEGGSIESDGEGTLMVTSSCLLSANRNDVLSKAEIEQRLLRCFHAERVLWLENSWLEGDDTDGHIDTVARFCSPNTIAYVKCLEGEDVHYDTLTAMERELEAFRTKDNHRYNLVPLPLPDPCYDDEGNRLPATYANFYIMNGAVLVPTYSQPDKDAEALFRLKCAFPGREVVGIDCRVLILQHGSLHCSTMQYPC